MKRNKTDTIFFILALISFLIALVFIDSQDIDIAIEDLDIDDGSSMSPTGALSGTIG